MFRFENRPPDNVTDTPRTDFVLGVLSAIFLISIFSYLFILETRLSKNAAYTEGVVVDKYRKLKGGPFIRYMFVVKNKTYRGSTGYSSGLQDIYIGDTCYIVYEQGYPVNNKLVRSEVDARCYKIKKPK